jgi:hypothetical protein
MLLLHPANPSKTTKQSTLIQNTNGFLENMIDLLLAGISRISSQRVALTLFSLKTDDKPIIPNCQNGRNSQKNRSTIPF